MPNDLSDHPDFNDKDWLKKATKAAEKDIRRLRRKGKWRGRMVSALLLVAIVAVGYVMYQRGLFSPGQPAPVASAPSTTVTSKVPDAAVNLSQPFVGTPAAGWADGEAGIVAPVAQPIGKYTAEQVADAYAKVRQVVIAARLDRKVIEGHDTERFLDLIAPETRAAIRTELADPNKISGLMTRIADGFRLLPVPPKVNGTMSATVGEQGTLVVHTEYVFAYAFHTDRPDELRSAMDIVAMGRWKADYQVLDETWPKPQRGVWFSTSSGFTYSMACGAAEKGMLAPWYSEYRPSGPTASHEPEVYFDVTQPVTVEDGCAT
ncbi:hypothetical protein SAMN05192558_103435 [Actinokineospora alba]|uniref:Uncharacterized protein n=1 Tax=Actinokineospora alba TaxID=504798 RepID=A0A1H0KD34_9PSEU|nr:hypothetical protein [Actinokineospora alba]TDP67950.1 hypothetical protein C8E96_3508 [Actinokineospora alba]SDH89501.1 hypothetical protein SAMN05421871_102614 [Actinokineospora alba]SDO53807.1 hypothetical protein SAMN05192558_103435 [Actinokineospora alba]